MLKVGFYEKEITPPLGADMPGGFCHRYGTAVGERIYAKAAAFENDGKTFVIITWDAVSTTTESYKSIIKRVNEYTGIPEENIIFSATHSHTSFPMHRMQGEFDTPDEAFFDVMERLSADTAILAYQRMVPVTVKYNTSHEKGLTFNRNYVMKDGSIRTNPAWHSPDIVKSFGPIDDEFTTLFFYDEEQNPVGAIANFACHNCSTMTGRFRFSSDYAGVLSDCIKKELGREFVTIFLSGACGNLNHLNPYRDEEIHNPSRHLIIGESLAKAALRHMESAVALESDSIDFSSETIYIKRQPQTKEEVEEAKYLYETLPLEGLKYDIDHPETKEYKRARATATINISRRPDPMPYKVQVARLGDVMIYGLQGEVYCEYGMDIKAGSPSRGAMISTLSNGDPCCYIPTPESRGTTIYEAQKTSAYLADDAGEIIVKEALSQAEKIK